MCIFMCIYMCMYVCVSICVYVYMYMYICIYLYAANKPTVRTACVSYLSVHYGLRVIVQLRYKRLNHSGIVGFIPTT
jgi:hypothetical protein